MATPVEELWPELKGTSPDEPPVPVRQEERAASIPESGARGLAATREPSEALIPIPGTVETGRIAGEPLLVGGADLVDSLATLIAYEDPAGPREVLHATVDKAAESKLLEALALSEEKLVPVAVEKEVQGRLPMDEEHQLFEQLEKVAKSVNHHLKQGDGVPDHTKENHGKLVAQLQKLENDPATTDDEKAMLAHYRGGADQVAERLAPRFVTAYENGGKLPKLAPHEVSQKVTVTEHVPAPAEDVPEGLLPTRIRSATRIAPGLKNGRAHWDGKGRARGQGKEYAVDLGDGYEAIYRPYKATGKDSPDFSHRGALEIVAPQGEGHGQELVRRLGQINLVNRGMTAEEGEWAYLVRNVWAQQLDRHKVVSEALSDADGLEDAMQEVLVAERAHEAVGMNEEQLVRFAKHIRLEAEARALQEKVRVVREAVAKTSGFASGDELAATPGYDPTPKKSGGWLVWERFDVAQKPEDITAAFGSKGLSHNLTGRNLVDVLKNGGVLASTERRRLMGITGAKGMSETADMKTGGARSIFLRVSSKSGGASLFWDDPSRLLRRADWYAYGSDHFGSLNPESSHSTKGQTRNPQAVAAFNGGSNEVMFRDGIDLLGAEAPTRIKCVSSLERQQVLALLAKNGITQLAGSPIEEVVG